MENYQNDTLYPATRFIGCWSIKVFKENGKQYGHSFSIFIFLILNWYVSLKIPSDLVHFQAQNGDYLAIGASEKRLLNFWNPKCFKR